MSGLFSGDIMPSLYGNEQIKQYIKSADEHGSLSHAYIFEGQKGSGRHTLALEICKMLAPGFERKIDEGLSPDIVFVRHAEDRKFITVDLIRDMKERAVLTPNELDFTAFIIEDAEMMNPQAQNALLKLLEEPPRGIYIFLLCESVNSLLPTILSRAPALRMEVFDDDKLSEYLLSNIKKAADLNKKDPEAFNVAVRGASGSIGSAIKLLDARSRNASDAVSANKAVISALDMLASGDKAGFFALCCTFTSKREELDMFFAYFESAIRDIITVKSGVDNIKTMFFSSYEEAEDRAYKFASGALIRLVAVITQLHEAVYSNVNIRLAETVLADRAWTAVNGL